MGNNLLGNPPELVHSRLSNPHLARLETLLFCVKQEVKISLLAMCQNNGSSCDERKRSVSSSSMSSSLRGITTSSYHLQQ